MYHTQCKAASGLKNWVLRQNSMFQFSVLRWHLISWLIGLLRTEKNHSTEVFLWWMTAEKIKPWRNVTELYWELEKALLQCLLLSHSFSFINDSINDDPCWFVNDAEQRITLLRDRYIIIKETISPKTLYTNKFILYLLIWVEYLWN